MGFFERGSLRLHYEIVGSGPPVLLLAPGGLRSSMAFWDRQPWDPRVVLGSRFTVVSMDQRNAGASTGPIGAGWADYRADQLLLMDHLGFDRFAVLGTCIGGPFGLRLLIDAPDRVAAAVLLQPIGLADNRALFFELAATWGREQQQRKPVTDEALAAFRDTMFGGDFVFGATRGEVRTISAPVWIGVGDDGYHPRPISEELAGLVPGATLVDGWKDPARAVEVAAFLAAHA